MSRRKVRGLTRLGRQVSEDPDLDNLLTNLSPEEMEELQKEVSTVPDPDPSELIIDDQTDFNQTRPTERDSSFTNQGELKATSEKNLYTEGQPRGESRKQEYLRKMGLSQESNVSGDDVREGRHHIPLRGASTEQEKDTKDKKSRVVEDLKDSRMRQFTRNEKNEKTSESKEKEQNDDYKLKDKQDPKEEGRKTKELISRLQGKKDDYKERRTESWKKESGERKTREMICRLQGKQEEEEKKEREMRTDGRKRQDSKMKGIAFKSEENQNLVVGSTKPESSSTDGKKKEKVQEELVESVPNSRDNEILTDATKHIGNVDKESEREKRENDVNQVKEELKISFADKEDSNKEGMVENFVAQTYSKTMTKEAQDEEESAVMFAEDLEKLRSNNASVTEVNLNNSEAIKVKTLIQFAEALHHNTHVKAFALANCRADDHVAYAIASMLRTNKIITSINMDSNLLTSKGIMALVKALPHNSSLTELRFHNQRHICGGKTEMEMTKILKENTTLLKLGYHFELAGPRMTMTNILSRNMDRQRQKRLQEQKQALAHGNGDKKDSLKVPHPDFNRGSARNSPKSSPNPSPLPSPKMTSKHGKGPPPPEGVLPPPPPPPPPILGDEFLKNSLSPMSQRKIKDRTEGRCGGQNSRDQLLASIRGANIKQLKKVALPKLLQ